MCWFCFLTVCGPGHFTDPLYDGFCLPCAANYYSQGYNSASCDKCASGLVTKSEGTSQRTDCCKSSGYFSSLLLNQTGIRGFAVCVLFTLDFAFVVEKVDLFPDSSYLDRSKEYANGTIAILNRTFTENMTDPSDVSYIELASRFSLAVSDRSMVPNLRKRVAGKIEIGLQKTFGFLFSL